MGAIAREPSMEDILASIRKIVSQDSSATPAPAARGPAPAQSASPRPQPPQPKVQAAGAPAPTAQPQRQSFADFARSVTGAAGNAAAPNQVEPPLKPALANRSGQGDASESANGAARPPSLSGLLKSVRESWPHQNGASGAQEAASAPASRAPAQKQTAPAERKETAPAAGSNEGAVSSALPSERRAHPMAEPPAIERRVAPAAGGPSGGQSALRAEPLPSAAEAAKFKDALVAPSVQHLVNSSLERLKQGAMSGVDARVEAVLRPMLKEWLDQHLPGLVEKLVRAEIDRIVREADSGDKA